MSFLPFPFFLSSPTAKTAGRILSINTSNDTLLVKDVPYEGLDDDGPSLGGQNSSGKLKNLSSGSQRSRSLGANVFLRDSRIIIFIKTKG